MYLGANYTGETTVPFVAVADMVAGDFAESGSWAGFVARDTKAGETAAMYIEGVHKVRKGTATFAAGATVDWDASTKEAVAATNGDYIIGKAAAPAVPADDHVLVWLNKA